MRLPIANAAFQTMFQMGRVDRRPRFVPPKRRLIGRTVTVEPPDPYAPPPMAPGLSELHPKPRVPGRSANASGTSSAALAAAGRVIAPAPAPRRQTLLT